MRTHVPTLEEMKPLVWNLASTHPDKTILVVSVDPINSNFNDRDPNYHLVPVYMSPVPPVYGNQPEFYQVYLLK